MKQKKSRTKRKKKTEEVIEDVIVKVEDVGDIIPITADENNPVSDGLEFKDGDKDE